MDTVSMIVAALVSGIIAGLRSTSERAVKDGYMALRTVILNKYQKVSIAQLEENPNSTARQAVVEEDLRRAGAEHDEETLQLAQELISLIESQKQPAKQSHGQPLLTPEELLEKAQRDAGNQAVAILIDKHLDSVMHARANYRISDQDLLSKSVVRNRDIPDSVRAEISQLHARIRSIIQEVASRIEERKYKTAEEAIDNMHLSLMDRERAQQIVQADKKVHVSYQALKTTVEFFANLNQIIIDKLEKAGTPQSEANLVLGNAILVYELTDYVIGYIENFTINGVDEIQRLHAETKQKIADLRRLQLDLEKRAQSELVEEAVGSQTTADIKARERSVDLLEQEWANYVEAATSLRSEVGKIRDKLPTLELIRDNAKVQIDLIQAFAMLRILKQNIGTMRATIITLEGMKLVSLSPNRVRRLLGIS